MVIGVYGIGYLIAARSPFQHWAIVFVGLLGKVFGPLGFLNGVASGSLPLSMGWMILTNDLIWWIPFRDDPVGQGFVTIRQWKRFTRLIFLMMTPSVSFGARRIKLCTTFPARSLNLWSFLRHMGCTFCREAVSDLSAQRSEIEGAGAGMILVHVGEDSKVAEFLKQFGLDDLERFSDPRCQLYRQFGLDQGDFMQLFGLRVWLRGFSSRF